MTSLFDERVSFVPQVLSVVINNLPAKTLREFISKLPEENLMPIINVGNLSSIVSAGPAPKTKGGPAPKTKGGPAPKRKMDAIVIDEGPAKKTRREPRQDRFTFGGLEFESIDLGTGGTNSCVLVVMQDYLIVSNQEMRLRLRGFMASQDPDAFYLLALSISNEHKDQFTEEEREAILERVEGRGYLSIELIAAYLQSLTPEDRKQVIRPVDIIAMTRQRIGGAKGRLGTKTNVLAPTARFIYPRHAPAAAGGAAPRNVPLLVILHDTLKGNKAHYWMLVCVSGASEHDIRAVLDMPRA